MLVDDYIDYEMANEAILNHRMTTSNENPLMTETRKVQLQAGSFYGNLTRLGTKKLNIEKGDELEIDIYRDKIVMRRSDDE